MKTLFPEMDQEIRDDRKAEQREILQRCRHYLKGRDFTWTINYLLDNGPTSEHVLMIEDGAPDKCIDLLNDLYALWRTGKLWRKRLGIHPGSGEQTYLYGIRKVHSQL